MRIKGNPLKVYHEPQGRILQRQGLCYVTMLMMKRGERTIKSGMFLFPSFLRKPEHKYTIVVCETIYHSMHSSTRSLVVEQRNDQLDEKEGRGFKFKCSGTWK